MPACSSGGHRIRRLLSAFLAVVVLALGPAPLPVAFPQADGGRVVFSVAGGRDGEILRGPIVLDPDDGLVIACRRA